MRRSLPTLLFLVLLVGLWGGSAWWGDSVYWTHDLRHHHIPWRQWAAREWLSGTVPLWAPGAANGFPLMADGQAGVFYPPTMLLFMALPGPIAGSLSLLLHTFWAALGAAALARALGDRRLPATMAGVAYGFSGFLATHALYMGMHTVASWLPWALVGLARRRWGLAGLALAAMCVAGHPQAAAFGSLLAVAFAVVHLRGRPLQWAFGATGLGIAAAGAQLYATWQLLQFTGREGGVSAAFAGIGSLPPQELLNGVLPRFFGFDTPADIQQTYYHRGEGYWGSGVNHWEMAFYLGVPAVALAVAGWRRRRFWLAVALLSIVLMLGDLTPAWKLLRLAPGFDGFRFPARFAMLLTLAVALLASSGLQALLDAPRDSQRRYARGLATVALAAWLGEGALHAAVTAGEPLLRHQLTAHFEAQVALPPPPADLPPLLRAALPEPEPEDPTLIAGKVGRIVEALQATTAPYKPDALLPVVLLGVLAALLYGVSTLSVSPLLFGAAALVLLAADLFGFGRTYQARTPAVVALARPAILDLVESEPGRWRTTVLDRRQDPSLDNELLSASLGLPLGTRDVILTSPLLMVRNEALLSLVGLDVGDRGPQKVERFLAHRPLVDLLGVRWLASVHEVPGLELLAGGPVKHYRNPTALPGAFLVGCAQSVDDPWPLLGELDPRALALVEGSSGIEACAQGIDAGAASIASESSQRIEIEVDATRPALLVQNDSWYPGWSATLDGQPVPLLRTDFLFRGVAVPEGAHRVVLSYRPLDLWAALGVSALAALAMLGLVLRDLRAWRSER